MNKFKLGLTTATVVAALALSGCSSVSNSGGSGDAEKVLSNIKPTPRDQLKEGGELKLAITSMPANWNANHIDGNEHDTRKMAEMTGGRAIFYKEDGTPIPNPDFIESWDVKGGKDGEKQVVTLKLNKKAKFNDGTPITWKAYANSLVCDGSDAHKEYRCASTDGLNQVESVTKGADDYEAVYTFKSSYPDWSAIIAALPDGIAKSAEDFNKAMAGAQNYHMEWGSGPFVITKVDESAKLITMERNPKWWGQPAILEKIVIRVIEESSAQSTAFANGEIDILNNIIDKDGYDKASKRPDAEVRRSPGLQWRHFTINSSSGVLQDVKVRQAVQMATDRASITGSDLAGLPVEPDKLQLGNHFFMPGQNGYKDNTGEGAYNPEKAKKLLDEAGWKLPEGKTVREKDGQPLEISYLAITGIKTSENEGQILQKNLAEVGISLKMNPVPPADFFPKYVVKRDFQITSFAWVGTPYPMNNIGQIYGCHDEGGKLVPNDSNYAALCLPEVLELTKKADVEMDRSKRVELANQVDALLWKEVHTIPIYQREEMTAVPKNLANYGAFYLTYSPKWEDVGFTK